MAKLRDATLRNIDVCVANSNLSHRRRKNPSLAPLSLIVSMVGCMIWPYSPSI